MFLKKLSLMLIIFSLNVLAEPSETPRYLMSEPMSIFDWGIYKINQDVKSYGKYNFTADDLWTIASYKWDENRIVLSTTLEGKGTKKECRDSLTMIKSLFANNTRDEKEQKKVVEERLNDFFSHEANYASTRRPNTIGQELIKILRVDVHILTRESERSLSTKIYCSARYNSSSIQYTEY